MLRLLFIRLLLRYLSIIQMPWNASVFLTARFIIIYKRDTSRTDLSFVQCWNGCFNAFDHFDLDSEVCR